MTNKYDFLKKLRYEYYKGTTEIMDNEVNELVEDVVDRLNTQDYYKNELLKIKQFQDQRISELEEQLKNAIVPKFKYGQNVWCVYPTNEYRQGFVFELEFVGYTKDKIICRITENEEFEYDEVFSTKEEAQAKLEELKGE